MNERELAENPHAAERVVHDLNADPRLPFADATFDAAVCCVSVDYLVRPIEVFVDVARIVRPGGLFVCTFSNRCFPTKAIRGWLATSDDEHCAIVAEYFRRSRAWSAATIEQRIAPDRAGDPLYAVWATAERRPYAAQRDRAARSARSPRRAGSRRGARPAPRRGLHDAGVAHDPVARSA